VAEAPAAPAASAAPATPDAPAATQKNEGRMGKLFDNLPRFNGTPAHLDCSHNLKLQRPPTPNVF
jgi:hypothetical protein